MKQIGSRLWKLKAEKINLIMELHLEEEIDNYGNSKITNLIQTSH